MNKRLVILTASMLGASFAFGQSKLTGFEAKPTGKGFEVQILGESLNQPKTQRVMGGKSLLLEFDADLIGKGKRQRIDQNGLDYVQSTWFSARPPKVRVHLRLDPSAKPGVTRNEKGWLVSWNADGSKPENVIQKAVEKSEPFPATVPPITAKVTQPNPTWATVEHRERTVTLDFVNTDVVQILKALAMQASVNIVTSPDVKGNLTVSLDKVTVGEALDLVTTLASVRYAKVGKAYVVTASSKFGEAMRQIGGKIEESFETRVVNIYSGEGTQIKAAVLRSTFVDTDQGKIELVLPSEELSVEKKQSVSDGSAQAKAGADESKTSIETKSSKDPVKDPYIVIIGPASKMVDIERQIKLIDGQICRAMGISVPTSNSMVRKVYNPRGTSAVNLLKAIAGSNMDAKSPNRARIGNVDLVATPESSISEQAIVLFGRENEVDQLTADFSALDSNTGSDRGDYLIYEVKHLDPRALREELLVAVPGLTATIPPASAANVRLFRPNQAKTQGADQFDENKTQGQTNSANQQGGGGAAVGGSSENNAGLAQPFQNLETSAVPMRLILRGSKEQINRAVSYLAAIDTAPKQVAIEMRVLDLSKEDAEKIGLDWSIATGGSVQLLRLFTGGLDPQKGGVESAFGAGGPNPSRLLATLDSVMSKGNTIARPNLFAFDGRESEIFVGDTIRYIESIQSSQNGVTVTTGQVPVGVRLAVLPRIGGDGSITMDLRPRVSSLKGFTPVPGGGNLPQTGEREAQMTVSIKNGDTIALGGLITDSEKRTETGIPILKDLPIIGRLFRGTDKSKVRSEVVFFITVKIIDDANKATAADPNKPGDKPLPVPGEKSKGKGKGSDKIIN